MEPGTENKDEKDVDAEEVEATAAHGIFKISEGNRFRNAAWCTVIIGVCVGFSLHLVTLVERYQSYPVNTEFEMKTKSYQFPDVTLCPTDAMSFTYGNKYIPGPFSKPGLGYGFNHMNFASSWFLHQLYLDNVTQNVPYYAYSTFKDGEIMLNKVAYRSKQFPEPHDIVIFCKFNSKYCSYKNFTVYKDEQYFACITFTPENRTVTQAGPGNGFFLTAFTYTSSYVTEEEEMTHIPGLKVVLHNRGEKPNFNGPQFLAGKRYKTVGVIDASVDEKVNRDSYRCVESLPNVTYVSDYSQLDSVENVTFFGTMEDCKIRTMQQEFARECGCLATDLPRPADLFHIYGVCHDIHEHFLFRNYFYKRLSPSYAQYQIQNETGTFYPLRDYISENLHLYNMTKPRLDCYHRVRNRQKTEGVNTDSCPVLCNTKTFSVTSGKYGWPRLLNVAQNTMVPFVTAALNAAKSDNLTLDDLQWLLSNMGSGIGGYMGVLDLYPRELSVRVSKEDWAYPLRNFFSDLGGILGLWIGASIVTIVEVMEMVVAAVVLLWSKIQVRKQHEIEEQEQQQERQQQQQEQQQQREQDQPHETMVMEDVS